MKKFRPAHIALLLLAAALVYAAVSCSRTSPPDDGVSPAGTTDAYAAPTARSAYRSPSSVAVSETGEVYIADATAKSLVKMNGGTVAGEISFNGEPSKVALYGGNVFVLYGGADGRLAVLDEAKLSSVADIYVGHTPSDIVFDARTAAAYVSCRFTGAVTAVGLNDWEVAGQVNVGREPVALTIAGNTLYAACLLPDSADDDGHIAASVAEVDLSGEFNDAAVSYIPLTNGAGSVRGIAASEDGSYVYATCIISRYQYPTTQLDRGWINTNALAVIDTASGELAASVLLDELELGAPNPWDIEVDGDAAYISLSGSAEVMRLNLAEMHDRIGNAADKAAVADDLTFLDGCRERIYVGGEGVRDIETDGLSLYCTRYFSGDVAVLPLSGASDAGITPLSAAAQPEADAVRAGEALWYDATKCYQQWESCGSCHPDGRADGFNWDNLNDGVGNPKQAKSMLYSHRTPPVMVTGIRATAELATRAGMKYIQFNTVGEDVISAVDEYLKALAPVPSPYLNVDGTLSEAAERGKALFAEYGCAVCHPAPLYTDMKTHDVNDYRDDWENRDFDTPTLVEVWRTAPYLSDGSAATLEDAVRKFAPDTASGTEIIDLAAYVASIGNEGEYYGVEQLFAVDADGNAVQGALPAGGLLTSISVRKQLDGAPECRVTVSLTTGTRTREVVKNLGTMADGSSVMLDLSGEELTLGEDASLTVSITDKKGGGLATDYVITGGKSK